MTQAYLGIDIAKKSFECSLRMHGKVMHRTFGNDTEGLKEMDKWLGKHKVEQLHAGMEATNCYWEAVAQHLYKQGYQVSVVNPGRIHDYARSKLMRNKTDKLDADVISDFCATQQPLLWTPPPAEVSELQALVRHLETIKAMRNQESNRLGTALHSDQVRLSIQKHVTYLDQNITQVEDLIQEHIQHHPQMKHNCDLLKSIPGISDTTAAKLLSENIQAFTSTRELVAYAGLNPQQRESGTSLRGRPQLSKVGRAGLRRALYFPAITAMRYNPLISRFCDRLAQKGKVKMVQIGAAMRKLLCLALGVLKSQVPFDPNFSLSTQASP